MEKKMPTIFTITFSPRRCRYALGEGHNSLCRVEIQLNTGQVVQYSICFSLQGELLWDIYYG